MVERQAHLGSRSKGDASGGRSFEEVWIAPRCGVQTSENRFGARARQEIQDMLNEEISVDGDSDDDDDNNGDGSSSSFSDDIDSISTQQAILAHLSEPTHGAQGLHTTALFYIPELYPSGTLPEDSSSNGASVPPSPSFPRIARARINLTAFSQHFNLYFAAYQDKIHVYRPQPAPEILPSPELVLRPPKSEASRIVRGYIDTKFRHQVNHLTVGNLGNLEILLMCYDDGDVVAYYTHRIAKYVERHSPRWHVDPVPPGKVPKPFFHETVGMSAWGLAVHSESRLIAVSSNLHEVTVFAFALDPPRTGTPPSAGRARHQSRQRQQQQQHGRQKEQGEKLVDVPSLNEDSDDDEEHNIDAHPVDDPSPKTWADLSALKLEAHLRRRDRKWRILLPLGEAGNNMPNISFWDDEEGRAEKVAGIDIHGTCWILDIWKVGSRPVFIKSDDNLERGWGVLVLPTSSFLKVRKKSHFLGIKDGCCTKYGQGTGCIDIRRSLAEVRDNASHATASLHAQHDLINARVGPGPRLPSGGGGSGVDDEDDVEDDDEDESETSDSGSGSDSDGDSDDPFEVDENSAARWDCLIPLRDRPSFGDYKVDLQQEETQGFLMEMVICPSLGQTWAKLGVERLVRTLRLSSQRKKSTIPVTLAKAHTSGELRFSMSKRLSILRTYDTSAELFCTDPRQASVVCRGLLEPHIPPQQPLVWDMHERFNRINTLLHVPELNMVVAGAMFGRVAILRLTRSRRGFVPERAFRVEWILPRKQEEDRRLRPYCCLLGVSISPVPQPGARRLDLVASRRGGGGQREAVYPGKAPAAAAAGDGAGAPRRWRLLLHYMDHTILQYYIEEKAPRAPRRDEDGDNEEDEDEDEDDSLVLTPE